MCVHIYVYRYKGVLAVRGMQKKYVFQGVHMVFSGGFVDIDWKPGEARDCRFVFIGRNLDKEALIEGFEECKAHFFSEQKKSYFFLRKKNPIC